MWKRLRRVAAPAATIAVLAGGSWALAGSTAPAAQPAAASPNLQLEWTQPIADGGLHGSPIVLSSPTVATLAGGPAAVVGDEAGKVYAFHLTGGSSVPGWTGGFPTGAPVTSTPSAVKDGTYDTVLVGTGNAAHPCTGGYQWIRPTGDNPVVRAYNPPGDTSCPAGYAGVRASMAVGTLQGQAATVAGSMGQNEFELNTASATVMPGFPWFQGDSDFSTPAIADLNGTGTNEIVEGGASSPGVAYTYPYTAGGHIRVLKASGSAGYPNQAGGLVCQYTTNQTVTSSPAVGKFLAGTAVGIVTGTGSYYGGASQTNQVIAVNTSCGVAWATTLHGATGTESPAVADVLGNNLLQVVETTATGTVYALNGANGQVIWSDKLPGVTSIYGSPVTANLGGGHQDVIVAAANGLWILTGVSGSVLTSTHTTTAFQNAPLVTKDPNGTIGITVAGAQLTQSVVFHFEVEGSNGATVNGPGAWPEFHHDPQLSGDAGTPVHNVEVTCKAQATRSPNGYYEVGSDGGIFDFNGLPFCGSMGGVHLNAPIVDMAAPSEPLNGYWEVGTDGGIFAFGTVGFFGSMGGKPLNAPIVGMAATKTGNGYYEVASDGGIFAFNRTPNNPAAKFYGSMGGHPLNAPIVGIALAGSGKGYYEVASDGGIFAFGTTGDATAAPFYGSMGGHPLNRPIVGIAATPSGKGYYEVASDGGIFAFGTPHDKTAAPFYGSMGGKPLNAPIVGMSTVSGGYWFVGSDGGIFAFSKTPHNPAAGFYGSMGGTPLNAPVVAIDGFSTT